MSQDPNQTPKNTENLSEEELKNTSGGGLLGGGLLGGDDSAVKGVTQGYVNLSNTDEDGNTSSTGLDFGSGSVFESNQD